MERYFEILQASFRSTLGSTAKMINSAGSLFVYAVGPYTSCTVFNIICSTIPILGIATFIWVPESPYYLLTKGRKQEALNSLLWYRNYPQEADLREEVIDML